MRSTGDVLDVLGEVAAVEVVSLPDVRLRQEILDLLRVVNVAQAALWRRVGSFERRGLAEGDGFRSTRSWLSAFGRMSPHAASGACARAAVLDQLPALMAAAQRGEVSGEHVARVTALVEDVGIGPVRAADQVLAELAASARPAEVGAACDRIRAHVDPDGAEPDPEAVLQRRGVTLARSGDMVRLRGQLDPEAGAVVMTALDALMAPPAPHDERSAAQRRADALTELARLPLGRDLLPVVAGARPQVGLLVTPEALLRQAPFRRTATGTGGPVADWIARLAANRGGGGGGGGGQNAAPAPAAPTPTATPPAAPRDDTADHPLHPPRVTDDERSGADPPGASRVPDNRWAGEDPCGTSGTPTDDRAGADPLAALGVAPTPERGWLTWTGPVATTTVQRIVCDSVIYRVLFDPVTGRPLDVGRTHRTAPAWVRRALHARDRGCRWPGCSAPTPWTDAHHLTMWRDDGQTNVDQMILVCRWHHTRVHEGGWRIRLDVATGEVHVTRPDGRPYELDPSPPWLGPRRAA
jgi:hypothetical protein